MLIWTDAAEAKSQLLPARRFVSDPLHNFVDLMYLANISLVVLDDKHSGYYLHGRNHSQHSDGTLKCAAARRQR
jgi:meckelin